VPRSMTGFGTAEGPFAGGRVMVELRTVNHRHFSVQCRLPSELQRLEADLRERLRLHMERGHATLLVRWTASPVSPVSVQLDLDRARSVLAALEELKRVLGLQGDVDLGFIARQPEVLTFAEAEVAETDATPLLALLDAVASQVVETREREGSSLATDLDERLTTIESRLGDIGAQAPERLVAERDRLRQAVTELLDGRAADENRLAQEIAFLADKMDITEEIVRLRTHVGAFREALASRSAVGRRLAFLGQEMLREVNTIGSKANDAVITAAAIDLKAELEKVREQVENLE